MCSVDGITEVNAGVGLALSGNNQRRGGSSLDSPACHYHQLQLEHADALSMIDTPISYQYMYTLLTNAHDMPAPISFCTWDYSALLQSADDYSCEQIVDFDLTNCMQSCNAKSNVQCLPN